MQVNYFIWLLFILIYCLVDYFIAEFSVSEKLALVISSLINIA